VGGLKGASSGLGLKVERSAKNLKELEEAEIRGGDVVVNFHLPGGKVETATVGAAGGAGVREGGACRDCVSRVRSSLPARTWRS